MSWMWGSTYAEAEERVVPPLSLPRPPDQRPTTSSDSARSCLLTFRWLRDVFLSDRVRPGWGLAAGVSGPCVLSTTEQVVPFGMVLTGTRARGLLMSSSRRSTLLEYVPVASIAKTRGPEDTR